MGKEWTIKESNCLGLSVFLPCPALSPELAPSSRCGDPWGGAGRRLHREPHRGHGERLPLLLPASVRARRGFMTTRLCKMIKYIKQKLKVSGSIILHISQDHHLHKIVLFSYET